MEPSSTGASEASAELCELLSGAEETELAGESTIVLRKQMLAKKQEELRANIKELEDSVAYIDWKQNLYDEILSGSARMSAT